MKKHNFSAGPCILPQEVLQKAADAVLNFNNDDLSLIEISHRSKPFVDVMENAQNLVLELLDLEGKGYQVTREYTGHGVGRQMHEGPQVPNYGKPGTGILLQPGMTIALEPMVLVGTHRTRVLSDQWTVVSTDGSLTAHFEHSVAVTEGEPLILTVL